MSTGKFNAGGNPQSMDHHPIHRGVEYSLLYLPTQTRFLIGGDKNSLFPLWPVIKCLLSPCATETGDKQQENEPLGS